MLKGMSSLKAMAKYLVSCKEIEMIILNTFDCGSYIFIIMHGIIHVPVHQAEFESGKSEEIYFLY